MMQKLKKSKFKAMIDYTTKKIIPEDSRVKES
jgi:hypothetical protein